MSDTNKARNKHVTSKLIQNTTLINWERPSVTDLSSDRPEAKSPTPTEFTNGRFTGGPAAS